MATDPKRAKSIFLNALDHSSESSREKYLTASCGDDKPLRHQVESLLKKHSDNHDLAEQVQAACGLNLLANQGAEAVGECIGPYTIREQIGEGGMGIVYVAEQTHPVRRKVAVKVIKPGMDTKEIIARFETERQALAMMAHANIARVLDAGVTESGRPYFVMDLVRGIPITEYCDQARLSPRERLALFIDVCDAVQHAHQKGIIHRDIKPANVLVTEVDGKPAAKVIDFGLAKATGTLSLGDKTVYSRFMKLMGTPAYMSPEQAGLSGVDIDTRSDIYSLGVLLYELLTGTTPIEKNELSNQDYDEIRCQIREVGATKPSQRVSTLKAADLSTIAAQRRVQPEKLRRELRGDLDWIVLKSLEKERRRRYETANALGEDIQKYLNHEPVSAVAPSPLYVLRKYAQRHRIVLATAIAFVALLLVAAVVSTSLSIRAKEQAKRADAEAVRANKAADDEKQARLTAQQLEENAKKEAERFRRLSYLSDMNAALHLWQTGDTGRAAGLLKRHLPQLGKEDLRRFEWYYLFKLCQRSLVTPTIECSSAAVAYSPDGRRLAFGDGHKVKVCDVETGNVTELLSHEAPVQDVSFSPNGEILASTSNRGAILLWDVKTESLRPPLKHGDRALSVEFSPDGTTLASSSWRMDSAMLWDVDTGDEPATLEHAYPVTSVAFSGDGSTVATSDWQGTLTIWSVVTRQQKHRLLGHAGPATCVAFSPNQDMLVSADSEGLVKAWHVDENGLALNGVLGGHTSIVEDLAFSPDGHLLASCGNDGLVKLWNVSSLDDLDTFRCGTRVANLAFSPDGKTLAAASQGGIKFWDTSQRPPLGILTGATGEVCGAVFSPNGKTLVSWSWDNVVRFWDTETWEVRQELPHDARVFVAAFSPDGKILATAGSDRTIRLWNLEDLDSDQTPAKLLGHPGWIWWVTFSPDGQTLVSAGGGGRDRQNGTVRLWHVPSKSEIIEYRYDGHPDTVRSAAFSPDGKVMASGSVDGTIRLWEIATHKERILTRDATDVWSAAFSPDGRRFTATAGSDAKLWDLSTGRVRTLEGHTAIIMHAVFLPPDGKTLLTAGMDGTTRLWDGVTGEPRFTFPNCGTGISCLAWPRDGKMIARCCRDRSIKLLHAATEEDVRATGWYENLE